MNVVAILNGILGLGVLVGIAFLLSNNKKRINWRLVLSGFGLQFVFAVFILKGNTLAFYFSPPRMAENHL